MSLRDFRVLMLSGLWAVGALSGCTVNEVDNDPKGPVYKYPGEADFCTALAKAQCSSPIVKECYGSDDKSLAGDTSSCVSARSDSATCSLSATGITNAPGRYNPAAAEACAEKQRSVYNKVSITRDEIDAAIEACIKVFAGDGTAGSSCSVHYDCDTTKELRCVVKPGEEAGTCVVPHEVAKGDDCADDAAECAEGLFCGNAGELGRLCADERTEAQDCSATLICAQEFSCENPDPETMVGKCTAKLGNGADCTADAECSGTFCEKAHGNETGSCVTKYELNSLGATCDDFK